MIKIIFSILGVLLLLLLLLTFVYRFTKQQTKEKYLTEKSLALADRFFVNLKILLEKFFFWSIKHIQMTIEYCRKDDSNKQNITPTFISGSWSEITSMFEPALKDVFESIRIKQSKCRTIEAYAEYVLSVIEKTGGASYTEIQYENKINHLIKKLLESCFPQLIINADCYVAVRFLSSINELHIFIANNDNGCSEIQRINNYSQNTEKESNIEILEESWNDLDMAKDDKTAFGYSLLDIYETKSCVKFALNMESHGNVIITGKSGSGKSTMMLWFLSSIMRSNDVIISLIDYKGCDEWAFLQNYPLYARAEKSLELLREYYSKFVISKKTGIKPVKREVLIIEELNSLVGFYSDKDKAEKTKVAHEIQTMLSQILAMGRSMGYSIILVMQSAQSSIFLNGTSDRLNFMVRISLGNLNDPEQWNMLYSGYKKPERTFKAGEGVILADGMDLNLVKYPMVDPDFKHHVFRLLMEDYLNDCTLDDMLND